MRIRTITGDTLSAAMAKIREELGPDAIILNVEDAKSRKGVVVRAAAESANLAPEMQTRAPSTTDVQIETRLEDELRAKLRMFQPARDTGERIDPEERVGPALGFHRIAGELHARLIRIAGEAQTNAPDVALAHALERTIGCGPLPLKPARPLIAVGAPGHGKTTALARLAAQAAAAGHPVSLLTLDTGKAGAVTQIETYGGLLKAQVVPCEDERALTAGLERCAPGAAIFVDTPGLNPWNAADLAQARTWIQSAGGEPIWIVSAETGAEDMTDAAQVYRSLGVRRMIATKLDAARRLGGIAAAAAQGPMALAGLISSPYLADGVEAPSHLRFAQRLLETAPAHTHEIPTVTKAKIA
jgi:flagellar biosynthesis protein FlhF